jgi:predicted acylesterase/phospholipase RssA
MESSWPGNLAKEIVLPLKKDKPLSLVLGAGGVRGMAHLGVLEGLVERGFQITEMVGASVGAIIISFYAAVGLTPAEMRNLGLQLTSSHLLTWAWLRRAPKFIQQRFEHRAGIIPDSLRRLSATSGGALHHGVERIGLLCYDLNRGEEVLFHNLQTEFPLADATRGAAAIPGLFRPRRCRLAGRELSLIDGGMVNRLPVDKLFAAPFAPTQILVIDISNHRHQKEENLLKVQALQRQHSEIPIAIISPDTIGKGTVFYRRRDLQRLIDAGRNKIGEEFSEGRE